MIIKSVHLKNIRSYLDARVDIPLGSTLLAGDIGSGKSTVLLAIDFALFGLRRGEVEGNDLLRHGKNTGEVEVFFEINGKEAMVRRTLRRTKNGLSQDTGILRLDGTDYDYTPMELRARILELLGYPADSVKKNKPIFRYTIYTPQDDMKRIMLDPSSRIETLRKIFGIDRYGTIRTNTKNFGSELRSISRETKALATGIEEKEQERRELEKTIKEAEKETAGFSSKLEEIKERISEKQEECDKLRDRLREHNELQKLIVEKNARISSSSLRIEDIEAEIDNFSKKITEYKETLSMLPGQPAEDVKNEISIMSSRRDALSKETTLLEEAAGNLSRIIEEGKCSMCGQSVDSENFMEHLNSKTELLKNKRIEFEETDKKLADLRNTISDIDRATYIRKMLTEASNYLDARKIEKRTLNEQLVLLEREISGLGTNLDDTSEIERTYTRLEAEIKALNDSRAETERKLASLTAQKKGEQKALDILKKIIEEKKNLEKKAKQYDSIDTWLSSFSSLMETIERHVMISLQQEFNKFFQQWFSSLMGDSLYVRIDESFSPIIEQNSFETRYENLSGGEKTAVALAYRLSLNKVINDMIDDIKTKDLLILDEPTDGFSTDQLDRIRDVINQLNLKQIIIVSHEPKIDTYVENVIRVYKENHISRAVL